MIPYPSMSAPLIYPGVTHNYVGTKYGHDGYTLVGGGPRHAWHETITPPDRFYMRAAYYHSQFKDWDGKIEIAQFTSLDRAGNGLRNLTPGHRDYGVLPFDVETNRMGSAHPQTALVGYQVPTNGYPSLYPLSDAMLNEIWEYALFLEAKLGIPIDFSQLISEPSQQEYGYKSKFRFSEDEWPKVTGHYGHERATENTHHDPFWMFGAQVKPFIAMKLKQREDDMAMFADVPEGHLFYHAIEWLGASGITKGIGKDTGDVDKDGDTDELIFGPNEPVTRGQMAAFLKRYHDTYGKETG